RFALWLLSRVESSRFSTRPSPNVASGMRKMMLFAFPAASKGGCDSAQLPASGRPATVNRSSTPPLGALVFTSPLLLKKKGNRAYRVGPLAVIKYGVVLFGATRGGVPLVNVNCGFTAGPDPPGAG